MYAEQPRARDLQILQYLGIPEAFSGFEVGNILGRGDIQNSGIASGGDPQVLLETRNSTGGTGLVLRVTGSSPGVEVRFQDLWSKLVIFRVTPWVVSTRLKTVSIALHSTECRRPGLPGSTNHPLE